MILMTVQPDSSPEQPNEVIHLGSGETAAVVPLAELLRDPS